jgi:formylglycine-generating enzyme required for sulfatase activity
LVVIPAGSFMMGSPENEQGRQANEGPQRQVTLHQAIALGGGPVTVGQFRAFVEATGHQTPGGCWRQDPERNEGGTDPALNWRNPGFQQADDHPVVCVSWEDAQAYVRWLSRRTGQGYRLPTEAEWEYAARAGTRTRWWWGARNEDQCRHANGLDQRMVQVAHAWRRVGVAPCNDGFAYTSPVGRFAANRFGLHDMGGNVWQWVEDCYRDSYEGAPEDASQAVKGGDCFSRVLRGGSWYDSYWVLRSAFRLGDKPGNRSGDIGFRVARTPGG